MIKLKQINVSDNLFLYYHKNLSVEIHSREAGIYVSSCDVQKLIQALQQVQNMKESME